VFPADKLPSLNSPKLPALVGRVADPHRPHPCRGGDRFRDLLYALGGYLRRREGGRNIDGPIKRWKPDINVVKAIIKFAKETGRLYLSV
jgi:hypothetical protein